MDKRLFKIAILSDFMNLQKEYFLKQKKIVGRLREFRGLKKENWIKEFVFCLLTPQSNAQRCWEAVGEIFKLGERNEEAIRKILKIRVRFHNTKAKRVVWAFENWARVRERLEAGGEIEELRNWLAENVNGFGLKEAGHFLRNIGKSESKIVILDRHILRNLKAKGVISDEKIKGRKGYLEMEKKFLNYGARVGIPVDELDLLFWSKENGEIFK